VNCRKKVLQQKVSAFLGSVLIKNILKPQVKNYQEVIYFAAGR
jgi:hypothetical protein